MEDICDTDITHPKRACKDFEIKKLGEYHEFCVQSVTLLPANVFNKFRNIFLEIIGLIQLITFLKQN